MELELSKQILEKSSDTKFYENPSSGNPVVPWTVKQTGDTKKLIVSVRNSSNAPQNEVTERTQQFYVQLQHNIRMSMTHLSSLLAIKFGVTCISVV